MRKLSLVLLTGLGSVLNDGGGHTRYFFTGVRDQSHSGVARWRK